MAYSDYGGYAYRNGSRVEDRSDAVLSPEGIKSTPGMWPGWTLEEGRGGNSFHVILGDGPIFVCLYKQSRLSVYNLGQKIDIDPLILAEHPNALTVWSDKDGKTHQWIETDYFKDKEIPWKIEVEGHTIECRWVERENHYQFVKLTQPDGNVWTGFSGYGVGAGLEDAGYGYDTCEQESRLHNHFPEAKDGE